MDNSLPEAVKFDEKGLVYAIAQGRQTYCVLMVVWMDTEVLQKAVETSFAHYYSRSYQKQWMKGEGLGHTQRMYELHLDCGGDVIVMLIDRDDGIVCYTGRESCFYKIREGSIWQAVDAVSRDKEAIYGYVHPQRSSENERNKFYQNGQSEFR